MTKREQIIEIAYKALFEAFTVGTKESAFSAENSEYWSPHFEYDIAPKITDAILVLDEQKESKSAERIKAWFKINIEILTIGEDADGDEILLNVDEDIVNEICCLFDKAMEEYTKQLQKVEQEEEKPTDEEIVASIPYPNPISKHQSDINIGWIKCRKAMRDNPEQFKDK